MASDLALDETFLPRGAVAPLEAIDAIRLGAFEPRSVVAGPGERAVIWVTGCLRRCPGCMKPEWFDFSTGTLTPIVDVAERVFVAHSSRRLDGVTFSGGEPFEQAAALSVLAAKFHGAGLNVLAYSGYRLAALEAAKRFHPLLEQLDFLIDAEYRRELPGPHQWRGSANQNIQVRNAEGVFTSETSDASSEVREVQLSLTAGALRLTGFPDLDLRQRLQSRLALRGIQMKESP